MTKTKKKTPTEFDNLGSLITVRGTDECLGYLMNFKGRGVYDATYGKVEVAEEFVEPHNTALTKSLIEGLDERCEIGQGYMFYVTLPKQTNVTEWRKIIQVKTFDGVLVSDDIVSAKLYGGRKARLKVLFRRNGKTFEGTNNLNDNLLRFKRVA